MKSNCSKKPRVVLINSSFSGGGTFCDFLNELTKENRCKYNWIPIETNPNSKNWINKLKCELIKVNKKYCTKPDVVSTLFDASIEAQLAKLQCYFCKIFLTTTVSILSDSFNDAIHLNKPNNPLYYQEYSSDKVLQVYAARSNQYTAENYELLAEKQPIEKISNAEESEPEPDALFLLNYLPVKQSGVTAFTSDRALFDYALANNNKISLIKQSDRIWKIEGTDILLKINNDLTVDDYIAAAGLVRTEVQGELTENQAINTIIKQTNTTAIIYNNFFHNS